MTSPELKDYHQRVNIPRLREDVAQHLESLAKDVRNGVADLTELEYMLQHLGGITYRAYDRGFRELWLRLRGLKVALRDE